MKKIPIYYSLGLLLPILVSSLTFAESAADPAQMEQAYLTAVQKGGEDAFNAQKNLVILYIKANNLPKADAACQQLLTDFSGHPELPEALYWIARQYGWSSMYGEEKSTYQQIIQNHPGSSYANKAMLGFSRAGVLSLIVSQNFHQAKEALDKLITDFSKHPDLADALYWIAEGYRWADRYEAAKSIYQRILEDYPDSSLANRAKLGFARTDVISLIVSQNYDQAKEGLDKLVTDFSGHPELPETLYWIAEGFRWADRYEDAKSIYQYILQNFPDGLYANKAKLGISRADVISLITSQKYDDAKSALDKLIADFSKHPDLPGTLYWIARGYGWSYRYEEEKGVYQQIIQNHPGSSYASKAKLGISRANVLSLIALLKDDNAKAALDKLIADFSEHPDLPGVVFEVGDQYWGQALSEQREAGQGKDLNARTIEYFKKALVVWERIIRDLPPSITTAKAYHMAAECYRHLGQNEKAIEYYQTVVDKWPDYEYAWLAQHRIAKIYKFLLQKSDMSDSAIQAKLTEAYEQLLKKYPDCPAAKAARTWLTIMSYN